MEKSTSDAAGAHIVVLIPIYNDWESLSHVLDDLDRHCTSVSGRLRVLVVDDGSESARMPGSMVEPRRSICAVDVLALRRNLGHQRAIAVGLAWIEAHMPCDAVVVMDGDGEDAPSDVPRLLARLEETGRTKVVFAARQRRSEGIVFQTFYHLYRVLHRILTGISVRVGNFSVIPWPALRRLVVVSDLWNHYAAAVFKARLPMTMIPTKRATRIAGQPTMNFTSLVMHGLSAMSVLGDRLGVRLLIGTVGLVTGVLTVALALAATGTVSIEGLSPVLLMTLMVLVVLLVQVVVGTALFAFAVLGRRDTAGFLPLRDYGYFVDHYYRLWPGDDE